MRFSPSAPTSAAGIVATNTTQAVRSSGVSTRRRATLRSHAPRRSRISRRKYATTATSVPRWSATSKVWLNASCSSRYVQSASHGTRIRCPDDEIGSSSVAPCTTPSTSACQFVSAPGSSPSRPRPARPRRPPPPRLPPTPPARASRQRYRRRLSSTVSTELSTAARKAVEVFNPGEVANCGLFRSRHPCRARRPPVVSPLRRARSGSRSKPRPVAVGGSRKSAGSVDETATGSANFFLVRTRNAAPGIPRMRPPQAPARLGATPPRRENHVDSSSSGRRRARTRRRIRPNRF